MEEVQLILVEATRLKAIHNKYEHNPELYHVLLLQVANLIHNLSPVKTIVLK